MKQVVKTEKLPIKLWLDDLEEGALEQAKNLANLPFAFSHIAIMPDSHVGYGMPIGGVLATKDYIVPNAVGVDIGCGMCAVKTSLKISDCDIDKLKKVMGRVRQNIPLGFNKHKKEQVSSFFNDLNVVSDIVKNEIFNAKLSLGTLGGGNHFIEFQKGDDGFVWIMVHSGSRNLGKQIAEYYNKVAVEENKKSGLVDEKWDLCGLRLDSDMGKAYFEDMKFCVKFALENRKVMMDRICYEFDFVFGGIKFDKMINIEHNYAALEEHFGKKVIVHRKGATSAKKGQLGIIPGSQGSSSYIVEGLGNEESFSSCSHGAGRKLGRKAAQRSLDFEEEKKRLEDMGVLHAMWGKRSLDEAPGAYKNIDEVMKNQKDLVRVRVRLEPLAVIKG